MIIEPKTGPTVLQPEGSKSELQVSAREKAIQRLISGASEQQAVPNASKVAPEELLAVTPQPEVRQNDTIEGTTAPVEAAKEETKAPEPEKVLSSEYAILARKEKALRARDQQLRAREAAIKASEDAKNASLAPKQSFDESKYISKDKLQQDLFGTLTELGLTYDQITAQALNAPTPEQLALNQELKSLKDEIKALRGETEGAKKNWETQQQESRKQAEKQILFETQALLKHNPEYETIRETGSSGDVVDLITSTFDKGLGNPESPDYYPAGTLLTVEEAASIVENHLVEEALKIARIKKIQQRLQSAAPAQSASPATAPKDAAVTQKQPQMKTLTNEVSSQRKLSVRERAILAGEGKLYK